jgi:hypothetical protein
MLKLFAAAITVAAVVHLSSAASDFEFRSFGTAITEQNFTGGGSSDIRFKGSYSGLARPIGELIPQYSGSFRLWVESDHDFSGRIDVGDQTIWLEGHFNSQGEAGVLIYKRYWYDCCYYELVLKWKVTLDLFPDSDRIVGVLESTTGWTSRLEGYRTAGDAARSLFARRYTLRLPTNADPEIAPPGEGYGAVSLNSSGFAQIIGALPDGTAFSRSGTVSSNGWWAFSLPLNEGRGTVLGWLQFTSDSVSGDLEWLRPERDGARFYPFGFSGTIPASGSRYEAPTSAELPLSWTDGIFRASHGNLPAPGQNSVTFSPGGKLTSNGGDLSVFTFKLNRSTGVFRGKFARPDNGKQISYYGVLDQGADVGAGYFLGTDQGGLVELQATP